MHSLPLPSHRLTGLVAATHTPFHPDGTLRLDVVEIQAAHLERNDVHTVFIGGSTGESHSLSLSERRDLARRWFDVTRGSRLRVVVHVGSNCLRDARDLAAQAQELGALAVSALAPSYFRPRDLAALIGTVGDIADAAPETPFYFYDIPSMTGVHFPMPEFLDLARRRIPNLAGLKFTNSDLTAYQLCLNAEAGRWDVPWGTDETLLAAIAVGARGAVGSTYNFAAPLYHRLLAAFAAGDLAVARLEQMRSVRLVQALARIGYFGAAKALMGFLGVPVGPARLPLGNPTLEQTHALRAELDALGFDDWIRKPAE